MALAFTLSAECGPNKQSAEAFGRHFQGFKTTIAPAECYSCAPSNFFDGEGWWCVVSPSDLCSTAYLTSEGMHKATIIASQLYEHLRAAPYFRFALVGLEVDGVRYYREIDEQDMVGEHFPGLVIEEAIWFRFGKQGGFVPFRVGYVWKPFVRVQ